MNIIDGQSMFNRSLQTFLKGNIWNETARRRGIQAPSISDNNVSDENPTEAHISHGRLLASCTNCNNAEYVWLKGPYLMICANCGNSDIEGKLRRVYMSPDLDDIIELLLERPNPENQNWFPNESPDDLRKENEAMLA